MRLLVVIAGLGLSGCLFLEPINDPPEISKVQRMCPTPSTDSVAVPLACDAEFNNVHRGDAVQVQAMAHDPDGDDQQLRFAWQVYACGDEASCDTSPWFHAETATPMTSAIPRQLTSESAVQLVHIVVDTEDGRGAHQTAVRSVVLDDGPVLAVRAQPATTSVGGAIGVFATYGDPDGHAADVRLDWTVSSPSGQPSYTISDRTVIDPAPDPERPTVAKTIVLGEVGDWTVTVVATDDHGKRAEQTEAIHVLDDEPPCIARWQPIAAPAPAALPVSARTLFQIPLVSDDLDPYPATSSLGAASFAWSIRPPGAAAFQSLGAAGNSMAFDPAAYRPGDVVELRVEVRDRVHTQISCGPDDATCSSAGTSCIQRLTWRVEAR